MALVPQIVMMTWDRTGIAKMYVTYDDVTGRISALRVDNQSERVFRVQIYETQRYSTVVFSRDVPPKTDTTQNIPPGQDYYFEDWIASGGLI